MKRTSEMITGNHLSFSVTSAITIDCIEQAGVSIHAIRMEKPVGISIQGQKNLDLSYKIKKYIFYYYYYYYLFCNIQKAKQFRFCKNMYTCICVISDKLRVMSHPSSTLMIVVKNCHVIPNDCCSRNLCIPGLPITLFRNGKEPVNEITLSGISHITLSRVVTPHVYSQSM